MKWIKYKEGEQNENRYFSISWRIVSFIWYFGSSGGFRNFFLVALGSAARIGCDMANAPVDAAIVGIVDNSIGLMED